MLEPLLQTTSSFQAFTTMPQLQNRHQDDDLYRHVKTCAASCPWVGVPPPGALTWSQLERVASSTISPLPDVSRLGVLPDTLPKQPECAGSLGQPWLPIMTAAVCFTFAPWLSLQPPHLMQARGSTSAGLRTLPAATSEALKTWDLSQAAESQGLKFRLAPSGDRSRCRGIPWPFSEALALPACARPAGCSTLASQHWVDVAEAKKLGLKEKDPSW